MIERLLKLIYKIYNVYSLKKQDVFYGQNLCIHGKIYIMGKVEIGNNVSINSGYKYNPIGGQGRTLLITHRQGWIVIGNNVGISNSAIVAVERVEIHDDVRIGGSCKIYDNDFHSLNFEYRMARLDTHIRSSPVIIKRGAFVGAHSIILKGVTIGERSVIGAGSVVTKSIPNGEMWAGNPARYIGKAE